jgi:dihydropteroate synthase
VTRPIRLPRGELVFDRPLLAGVINVTPDSFSDGGARMGQKAVDYGIALVADGADIIDVGGESTRPGASAVDADEERRRVLPVIEALAAKAGVPIAIDTTKASVAREAIAAGAQIINDVSGGAFDPEMITLAAESGAAFVLGHVRGASLAAVHAEEVTPPTTAEVISELVDRLARLPEALRGRVIVDPGLGFGKRGNENLALIAASGRLADSCRAPVMIGPSRKRFLGPITGRAVADRDAATIGACLAGAAAGAHILRVHAVRSVRDALQVFLAVRGGSPS